MDRAPKGSRWGRKGPSELTFSPGYLVQVTDHLGLMEETNVQEKSVHCDSGIHLGFVRSLMG